MLSRFIKRVERKLFCRTAEANASWYKKNTGIKIGNNCKIFPGVCIGSEPYLISIGDDVELTDGVSILTHDGAVKVASNMGLCSNADLLGRVVIGNNVFVGVNSIIMPGVRIGDNVIVGAGSIVTEDVAPDSVVCGIPAKRKCSVKEYYEKNRYRIFETDSMTFDEKRCYIQKQFSLEDDAGMKKKQ